MSGNRREDMSNCIDAESMPCCPICGNEIEASQAALAIIAHGARALAHEGCVLMKEDHYP